METVQLLTKFVRQRPGLDFCNYGDRLIYQREMREITKDLHDFNEVLRVASIYIDDIDSKLKAYLQQCTGRLTMVEDGKLQYITGQYFPTEYRPAATRILTSLLWDYVRKNYAVETGDDIRKKLRNMLSRRVMKNYF
jgi:hypothetical protein